MRTSKFLTIGIFLTSTIFFSQCEVQRVGCADTDAYNYDVSADIHDSSACLYYYDPTNGDCTPDNKGNLVITNQTDEVLYLYRDFAFMSCIPANAENFIIDIPNESLSICRLQIWKAKDVPPKISEPDISNVYRQWSVALSDMTTISERANWLITDDDDYAGSGTINLTYPDIDEYGQSVIYQVDVFLNSKSGAKLASLQPGVVNKKVSVDYGVHYLFFRYWYSDPNSTTGEITELGWSQNSELVINAAFESADVTIPFFYSNVGKYGELKVYNERDNLISIYANDVLIESITKIDGSTQGLSIIPAHNATTFLIPSKSYTITARSVDGSETYASFKDVEIIQDEQATKWIGIEHQTISFNNNTEEALLLYSLDDEYLGVTIAAGESSGNVLVPSSFDSLMVVTGSKTQSKVFEAGINVNIDELEGYIRNELNITDPWNIIGDNHYRSSAISDNQETTMTAVLINDSETVLSFDYLVSSEPTWDYFSFVIDGETIISAVSGEVDWTSFNKNITSGTHTLEWKYSKDQSKSLNNDYVEIRNILTE